MVNFQAACFNGSKNPKASVFSPLVTWESPEPKPTSSVPWAATSNAELRQQFPTQVIYWLPPADRDVSQVSELWRGHMSPGASGHSAPRSSPGLRQAGASTAGAGLGRPLAMVTKGQTAQRSPATQSHRLCMSRLRFRPALKSLWIVKLQDTHLILSGSLCCQCLSLATFRCKRLQLAWASLPCKMKTGKAVLRPLRETLTSGAIPEECLKGRLQMPCCHSSGFPSSSEGQ